MCVVGQCYYRQDGCLNGTDVNTCLRNVFEENKEVEFLLAFDYKYYSHYYYYLLL